MRNDERSGAQRSAGMDRRPSPHRENWAAWLCPPAPKFGPKFDPRFGSRFGPRFGPKLGPKFDPKLGPRFDPDEPRGPGPRE